TDRGARLSNIGSRSVGGSRQTSCAQPGRTTTASTKTPSVAADGEITEEELDTLALAIERVLPPEIRKLAAEKRKRLRIARREAGSTAGQADRAAALRERERARPLHLGDFIIAGAKRSAERREACDGLTVSERVILEREPDNEHDKNAILILTEAGD